MVKFTRETLLNYVVNRWGLNKSRCVGTTSDLIRSCSPSTLEEWEAFYYSNAKQKRKNGENISKDHLVELGKKLYSKLSIIREELDQITEEECINYIDNLIINRTFDGYNTEIDIIYNQLKKLIDEEIIEASDEWDRTYSIDYYILINNKYIGLQIKPVSAISSIADHRWEAINNKNHARFLSEYKCDKIFYIFSAKGPDGKKRIVNIEVVEEIKQEIKRIKEENIEIF